MGGRKAGGKRKQIPWLLCLVMFLSGMFIPAFLQYLLRPPDKDAGVEKVPGYRQARPGIPMGKGAWVHRGPVKTPTITNSTATAKNDDRTTMTYPTSYLMVRITNNPNAMPIRFAMPTEEAWLSSPIINPESRTTCSSFKDGYLSALRDLGEGYNKLPKRLR